MSAQPRFWPASRAAARRRVSRRGFFAVAGVHLAALAGVVLLSAGPAKVTVAAGRPTAGGGEVRPAPSPAVPEAEKVVWMDPATFQTPPPTPDAPPPERHPPEEPRTTVPASPPPSQPALRPLLDPPPRPVPPHPKSTTAVPRHPAKSPPAATRPRATERGRTAPAAAPRTRPAGVSRNPTPTGNADRPSDHAGTGSPDTAVTANDDGPAGDGGTDWYAAMLHERFYARWEQPTSPFASPRRYLASLRLRIERDGRISDYRLVRSSGLVPMDESVLAAAARVGRVDPPPAGLLRGGAYVVNVGFVRE